MQRKATPRIRTLVRDHTLTILPNYHMACSSYHAIVFTLQKLVQFLCCLGFVVDNLAEHAERNLNEIEKISMGPLQA